MIKFKPIPKSIHSPAAAKARVAIAKDVIQRLDDERLLTTGGTYCSLASCEPGTGKNLMMDAPAHLVFNKNVCEVCAVGGLLVSAVCMFDRTTVGDLQDSSVYSNPTWFNRYEPYLSQFFSNDQLRLIEAAFEKRDVQDLENDDLVDAFEEDEGSAPDQWVIDNECDVLPDAPAGMEKALAFSADCNNDRQELMYKIMNNIVVNKGSFVP